MSNFQAVGHWHCRREYIASADHHDFIGPALDRVGVGIAESSIETCGQHRPRRDQTEISREHDVGTAWK